MTARCQAGVTTTGDPKDAVPCAGEAVLSLTIEGAEVNLCAGCVRVLARLADWRALPVLDESTALAFRLAHAFEEARATPTGWEVFVSPADPGADFLRTRGEGATLVLACEDARRRLYRVPG